MVPVVALPSKIRVRAVKQTLVEEGKIVYYLREDDSTVVAWGVYGLAVLEEKLEEGELPVRGRGKNIP